MAQPKRSAERAAQIIDRAAKAKRFRAPLLERRVGDPQMRTPGFDPSALRPDRIDPGEIRRLGMVEVPVDKIRTSQPTVSVAKVKAKIGADAQPPQLVRGPGGTWSVYDGNHTITAMRAQNAQTIKAWGGEIAGTAGAAASKAAGAYRAVSPYLQAAGIVAAASTAYNHSREYNGTRAEALSAAARAAAPGAAMWAGAAALGRLAPAAAGVLGKVNPIVLGGTVAYSAAKGAWEGYNAPARDQTWGEWAKGQQPPRAGWVGAAKGAAFGAADALTFGMASAVAGRTQEVKLPKGWNPYSGNQKRSDAPRLDAGQARAFAAANAAYEGQKQGEPADPTRPGYKDTWSDSRGRSYTRRNMAVRTRQDMREAA